MSFAFQFRLFVLKIKKYNFKETRTPTENDEQPQPRTTSPPSNRLITELIKVREDLTSTTVPITSPTIGSATTADSSAVTASEATVTPATGVVDSHSPPPPPSHNHQHSTKNHHKQQSHGIQHHELCPAAQTPQPIDWTPQDKCYFCVNGKLLTVNEKGDLVTEVAGGSASLASTRAEPAEIVRRVSSTITQFKANNLRSMPMYWCNLGLSRIRRLIQRFFGHRRGAKFTCQIRSGRRQSTAKVTPATPATATPWYRVVRVDGRPIRDDRFAQWLSANLSK